MTKTTKNYLAITFYGTGSSWGWGATHSEAATNNAREVRDIRKRYGNQDIKGPVKMTVYDVRGHDFDELVWDDHGMSMRSGDKWRAVKLPSVRVEA